MRYIVLIVLAAALAGCVAPPKKDGAPEPLPAHPAGIVSKGALPPPVRTD